MTIHDFDMTRFLSGSEVVRVYATGAARIDPAIAAAGDIDTAVVVLGLAAKASLAGGRPVPIKDARH
jgi:myo-inositol 2-dehydrogenase/D-chiro-inositol 1-dehydrogenase